MPGSQQTVVEARSAGQKILWRKGKMIGQGANGRVYVGLDAVSGNLIAAKEFSFRGIPDYGKKVASLQSEITIMKDLRHENIVRYIGADKRGECFYIFMEYVPGGSVRDILNEFGAFPEDLAKRYVSQILKGLGYLHGNGVLHRDVKGANILVSVNGRVKLTDFGSAHQFDSEAQNDMRGTAYWVAPEVIRAEKATPAADIWSVGCTLLEMLTGGLPFAHLGNGVSVMSNIGDPTTNVSLPPDLDISSSARDFLLACFNKNPHCRATARELLTMPFLEEGDVPGKLQSATSVFGSGANPPEKTTSMSSEPQTSSQAKLPEIISSSATEMAVTGDTHGAPTSRRDSQGSAAGREQQVSPFSSVSIGSWARGADRSNADRFDGASSVAGTVLSDQHQQSLVSRALMHASRPTSVHEVNPLGNQGDIEESVKQAIVSANNEVISETFEFDFDEPTAQAEQISVQRSRGMNATLVACVLIIVLLSAAAIIALLLVLN